MAQSHAVAAMVTWAAELHDEALDHAVQALEASVGHVDVFALRTALPVAAAGALDRGAPERAARLLGFYVDLLERTGHGHWPTVADLVVASTDAVRRALGTRAAMFQARGAAATTTQIVEDAAALVR